MADPTQDATKRCPTCDTVKPISAFHRDRTRRDGRYATCAACKSAKMKARYYEDVDESRRKLRERMRAMYAADPERFAAQQRELRRKDPEKFRERNRQWREANAELEREINAKAARRWRLANPDVKREAVRRYRAQQRAATVGPVDLALLWSQQDGICPLCERLIDLGLKAPDPFSKSVDHIVPLSKGGTHEQSNLQWTHLVCNIRKGAKAP